MREFTQSRVSHAGRFDTSSSPIASPFQQGLCQARTGAIAHLPEVWSGGNCCSRLNPVAIPAEMK